MAWHVGGWYNSSLPDSTSEAVREREGVVRRARGRLAMSLGMA